MAMMMGMSGKSKLLFLLMFSMIGIRLGIFVLSTVGMIAWAPPLGASVLSWILPVGMPILMISYMLLFRRRMMHQQMTHSSDDATAAVNSPPQLFPPMAAMQSLLSKKSHKKRNIAIVAGFVGFMVSMHILLFGGFLIPGATAPYGMLIILAAIVAMFIMHSRMTKHKPSPARRPELSSTEQS
jgi:hypothetical protein